MINSQSGNAQLSPREEDEDNRMCVMEQLPKPVFPADLDAYRESAILENYYKWVNGTVIHYYIISSDDATDLQKEVVRQAFKDWEALGIGLRFSEVDDPREAELRIVFDFAKGRSSSYIGTYNLRIKHPEPTMRFGWDLTTTWGTATARHEIGHAIGLKHEHQNPNAGIVWDEPAVIKHYKKTNNWAEETTRHNVINKLDPDDITATVWNVKSIMHYPIKAGLIIEPTEYNKKDTPRNTTFSSLDISFVQLTYPPNSVTEKELRPMMLVPLPLESGQQADLILVPEGTRDYQVQTVGKSDSRLVVFEVLNGEPRFFAADDDSAEDRNASLRLRLVEGREYILRVRLYSAFGGEGFGVMMV